MRRALQLSLNVPAVAVLDKVGAEPLRRAAAAGGRLARAAQGRGAGARHGLGGVGVRLADLTMLYAGLARLGGTVAAHRADRTRREPAAKRRLLDPVAAWYVANILLGTPPPENAAGGRIAFKTGTSYGYRDAWAVGFDGKRTIGVWVGRPDGAPVRGLVGRIAAAPILFDAFARGPAACRAAAAGAQGRADATTASCRRRFSASSRAARGEFARPQLRIVFPPNGASLELVSDGKERADPIAIKVSGGTPPLTVLLNGLPLTARTGRTLFFEPEGPGFVRLTTRRLVSPRTSCAPSSSAPCSCALAISAPLSATTTSSCATSRHAPACPCAWSRRNSSSCFSLIDLYMLRDAPLSLLGLVFPRLARARHLRLFVALPIWLAWWTSWLRLRQRPTRIRRARSRDSIVAVTPAERSGEERDERAVEARHVALPRGIFPDLGERQVRRAHAVAVELMPVVVGADRLGGPLQPRHELGEQSLHFRR